MAHLAIIDSQTDIVVNIVVPPQGVGQVYFVADGHYAVETESGSIGDSYDESNGKFIKPESVTE